MFYLVSLFAHHIAEQSAGEFEGGEAIENALQELDILTQEARRTLLRNQRATRDAGNRPRPSNRATRNVDEDLKVIEEGAKCLVKFLANSHCAHNTN